MRKHIGADMRLGFNGDIAVRPEFNKRVDNILRTRVLDSGCEFAVRKVPAPPSPNMTLLFVFSSPWEKNVSTSALRSAMGFPRSITMTL